MDKVRRLCLLIWFFVLPLSGIAQPTATLAYPLSQVMITGAVSVQFRSTGASSGDSILLTVSKAQQGVGDGSLFIEVPPGTRLNNVSGTGQSMVIAGVKGVMQGPNSFAPAASVELSDYSPHTYILSAYCAEFNKDNPSPSSTFSVGAVDRTLACILSDARTQGLSVAATQAAVWIYTDRVTFEKVQHKFQVSSSDWSAATLVSQRCMSTNPQQQQAFTPQQLSMQGSAEAPQPGTLPPSGRQEQGFQTYVGTLYVSPGRVRLEGADKNPKTAEHLSWSASCNQIKKWKKQDMDWMALNGGVLIYFTERLNGWKSNALYVDTKEEEHAIIKALSDACGQPWEVK